MKNPNVTRARRAAGILRSYKSEHEPKGEDDQTALTDLLADLMHFSGRADDVRFDRALESARMHFEAEVENPEGL